MYLTENAPFLEHFLFYLAIVVYLVPYLVAFDIFLLVSSKGLQFRNSKGAVTRGNCYCNLQATALQCPVFAMFSSSFALHVAGEIASCKNSALSC